MCTETKNLNTKVHEDLYWDFKREAAKRRESMPEAVENALKLYLSIECPDNMEVNDNDANA